MRRPELFALVVLLAVAIARDAAAAPTALRVTVAVSEAGAPTDDWLELLRRRLPPTRVAEAAALVRPLTPADRAWARLAAERVEACRVRFAEIVALFEPVAAPETIRVILGNRAGEDAFTHDATTIGFDLSRLADLYGDAAAGENRERFDRLFLHEYTHLLQKAWLRLHPQPSATPFERAELEIWSEGLGNYRSMSARWRARDGVPSDDARAALARLEPLFVARMAALACATEAEAVELTADLSMGPFAEKWGALTAALWLEQEASVDPLALRRFAQGGAAQVRALARRHLAPEHAAELERARARAERCP